MSCVVCEQPPNTGYCEFCPVPPMEPITGRDPGDENDYRPSIEELVANAYARLEEWSRITARTYRVTYRVGHIHRTATMTASEDFFTALEEAKLLAQEGEVIVGMSELV